MISPDFRNTEVPNLLEAFKTYIVANHGMRIGVLTVQVIHYIRIQNQISKDVHMSEKKWSVQTITDLILSNYENIRIFIQSKNTY